MTQHERILKELSEEYHIDPRIIDEVVKHYLGMIRRIIGSGSFLSVDIRGLGKIRPKPYIQKQIILGRDPFADTNQRRIEKGLHPNVKLTKKDILNNLDYGKQKDTTKSH